MQWVVGCGTGLATVAGFELQAAPLRPGLPAEAHYASLPAQFEQALQTARGRVATGKDNPEEVRKLARLYQANRLYPEVRACYRVIEATAGLTAQDHYYIADIAQNENDLAEAQRELRAVLQTEPDYVPARLTLAEALFKSGREDAAEKEYAAVLAIEANQPQASVGLARIELQRGSDEAAMARLEELMAAHPDATAGAALFARLLERRGETDRAVAMTQWSQQKPGPAAADPWKDALLGDCYDIQRLSIAFEEYFKAGRMDEALPLLDRLAVLDPTGPITKMFSGFSHAKALQHITAVREYYEALASGGDPEKICPYLVQSLLALGKATEAAKIMADYCVKLPDSIPLAKTYADVAVQLGDERLARQLLTKVLEKEPHLRAQNMGLAKILWTAGERDAAVNYLQRVATMYADDVPSRALLGEYFLGKGDPLSAIPSLEQASKYAAPKTPAQMRLTEMLGTAYLQAGNGEVEKGHLPEAANLFDKAIHLAPADLQGYAGKASVCVQLKQFRRAAEALEKMAGLQPDNPTIFLSLGDVWYQDGDAEQARRQWQKALQLTATGDLDLRNALGDRLGGRITAETFK